MPKGNLHVGFKKVCTNVHMPHGKFRQTNNHSMSNQIAPYDSLIDFCEDMRREEEEAVENFVFESFASHVSFAIMIRGGEGFCK